MLIEFTNAYARAVSNKFCLVAENIIYFSKCPNLDDNKNYIDAKSFIETLGGTEESQLYYVKESYEEIKEMIKNATK